MGPGLQKKQKKRSFVGGPHYPDYIILGLFWGPPFMEFPLVGGLTENLQGDSGISSTYAAILLILPLLTRHFMNLHEPPSIVLHSRTGSGKILGPQKLSARTNGSLVYNPQHRSYVLSHLCCVVITGLVLSSASSSKSDYHFPLQCAKP